MKHCPDCRQDLPLAEFTKNARSRDGLSFYCRGCASIRNEASRRKRLGPRKNRIRPKEVIVPDGHKRCPECGEVKPLTEFPTSKRSRSGYLSYCKPCHLAACNKSREKQGGNRNYHLRRRYGITAEHYDRMLEEQSGLCAICRERPAAHVDHDHATGRVRGLLCFNCNQALGNFTDRRDFMLAAIAYLDANGFVPLTDRPAFGFSLFHGNDSTGRPDDEPPWPDDEQQIA
jgi:hypothetical protein